MPYNTPPDNIPLEIALPLAAVLWAGWFITVIYNWKKSK